MAVTWDQSVSRLIGATVTDRPGALTWDGRTAHEIGPVALSDVSEGLAAYAWRAYIDGNSIYIQRETDAHDDWQAPQLLTTYSGAVANSLDLTFDQNGKAWAVWEQSGQIGLYWFDTQAGTDAVRDLGAGRTPTLRLDIREPQAAGDSDILLFYISDANARVEYLRQRDRLNTVFATSLTTDSNTWLELLAPASNNRLYLWFTRRDAGTGEYTLHWWHSAPYPFFADVECVGTGPDTLESATLRTVIKNQSTDPRTTIGPDTLESGSLRVVVKDRTLDVESALIGPDTVESASLRVVIKDRTTDTESAQVGPDTVESASIRQVIIDEPMGVESAQVGPDTVTGGSKA